MSASRPWGARWRPPHRTGPSRRRDLSGIVTLSMLLRYDQMVAAVERNATHGLTAWLNALPDPTVTEECP